MLGRENSMDMHMEARRGLLCRGNLRPLVWLSCNKSDFLGKVVQE